MQHTGTKKWVLITAMVMILVLSTVVYVGNMITYVFSGLSTPLESMTYLAGYLVTGVSLCFAICEIKSGKNHNRSLGAAFICMALRLVYDILTVVSDGFHLTGFMQMDAFLVLDVAMLICIVILLKTGNRTVNILLVVLTAVYLFGEAAGYPMQSFDDLDEFVLMFDLLAVHCLPLFTIHSD